MSKDLKDKVRGFNTSFKVEIDRYDYLEADENATWTDSLEELDEVTFNILISLLHKLQLCYDNRVCEEVWQNIKDFKELSERYYLTIALDDEITDIRYYIVIDGKDYELNVTEGKYEDYYKLFLEYALNWSRHGISKNEIISEKDDVNFEEGYYVFKGVKFYPKWLKEKRSN